MIKHFRSGGKRLCGSQQYFLLSWEHLKTMLLLKVRAAAERMQRGDGLASSDPKFEKVGSDAPGQHFNRADLSVLSIYLHLQSNTGSLTLC